jgi:light-regulated signal transduction histidine kinase (bacteriophytochrome)
VQASLRLSGLVDDLLTYARTGRREVEWERVDLSSLMSTAIDEVLAEAPLQVEVQIQQNLTAICDAVLMHLIFRNLVENSVKYRDPNIPLKLEFGGEEDRHRMVYFVRDNGIGIDMAYADKLFRPFQRMHNSADIPGTGIGLANVRRAMQVQGGEVWLDAALGRGTTIFFTLGGGESPAQRASLMQRGGAAAT